MNKLLILFLLITSISFSQSQDTTLSLQKVEYIGVIKGIKYLESKDSLVLDLISDYDKQIDNYKKLQVQDSLKFHYTNGMLKETTKYKNNIEKKLDECENPPFYNNKIAFALYGMILTILIGIAF